MLGSGSFCGTLRSFELPVVLRPLGGAIFGIFFSIDGVVVNGIPFGEKRSPTPSDWVRCMEVEVRFLLFWVAPSGDIVGGLYQKSSKWYSSDVLV